MISQLSCDVIGRGTHIQTLKNDVMGKRVFIP